MGRGGALLLAGRVAHGANAGRDDHQLARARTDHGRFARRGDDPVAAGIERLGGPCQDEVLDTAWCIAPRHLQRRRSRVWISAVPGSGIIAPVRDCRICIGLQKLHSGKQWERLSSLASDAICHLRMPRNRGKDKGLSPLDVGACSSTRNNVGNQTSTTHAIERRSRG
jgi:hypothetical protein